MTFDKVYGYDVVTWQLFLRREEKKGLGAVHHDSKDNCIVASLSFTETKTSFSGRNLMEPAAFY